MKKEIKIPEIAENVDTATVAGILVSKGDKVEEEQGLVELETDKATTDLPSPFAGEITEIKVGEGDEVKVGQTIMLIESDEDGQDGDSDDSEEKEVEKEEDSDQEKDEESDEKEKEKSEPENKPEKSKAEKEDSHDDDGQKSMRDVPAAPSVRRLAREMDVDLREISGSGPGGRITKEDVQSAAEGEEQTEPKKSGKAPDFSNWGQTSTEDMSTIRKITARNVSEAWTSIPHVTQIDEADITGIEAFRKAQSPKFEKQGEKLTVTAILLKVVGFALQKFPRFNASIDAENEKIIYKHYFNVGIAVDTPQGLLVPVIREVNQKSLLELTSELNEMAEKARAKKLRPEDMQGGNFTISNLGGIGGTSFTPIVLPPQVAILGVSRASYKPVYDGEELEKRMILPLSLSYDHRVIDGADGARFLKWICDALDNPYNILQ